MYLNINQRLRTHFQLFVPLSGEEKLLRVTRRNVLCGWSESILIGKLRETAKRSSIQITRHHRQWERSQGYKLKSLRWLFNALWIVSRKITLLESKKECWKLWKLAWNLEYLSFERRLVYELTRFLHKLQDFCSWHNIRTIPRFVPTSDTSNAFKSQASSLESKKAKHWKLQKSRSCRCH